MSYLISLPVILFYGFVLFCIYLFFMDRRQKQHSVLRTHPLLGRFRYLFEKLGPPMRQYWFSGDKDNRPVDRITQETIAKAGKYGTTLMGFGSRKDFSGSDVYLNNSMFSKNVDELKADNAEKVDTYKYEILRESEFSRKEKRVNTMFSPWKLTDETAIIIGAGLSKPFRILGPVGISAMSFGSLSKSAIKALNQGVAVAGGSWQNTGEGGISPYHLSKIYTAITSPQEEKYKILYGFISKQHTVSNFEIMDHIYGENNYDMFMMNESEPIVLANEMTNLGYIQKKQADLIYQLGSGLFGARDGAGVFSDDNFRLNATREEVKAIEVKLAQGAKIKGGHLEGSKVSPIVAKIRNVPVGQTIESPNRHKSFHDVPSLFDFIDRLRDLSSGKPVGIKVVLGADDSLDEMASYMKESGRGPNFITVDGGEGGTGATFQEMADRVGLPIMSAIIIADNSLRKFGVRDRVKIFASGMLATSDKMALALACGADLINVARAAMNSIGCLNSFDCASNNCPVGVATQNPVLEQGLVVEEKRFRTANYIITMRSGLFSLAAACGIDSPTKFERHHVTYRDQNFSTQRIDEMYPNKKNQA